MKPSGHALLRPQVLPVIAAAWELARLKGLAPPHRVRELGKPDPSRVAEVSAYATALVGAQPEADPAAR